MTATIYAPRYTPEVICCEAYLRWHQIEPTLNIDLKNLGLTRGYGRPMIQIEDFDLHGFDSLYTFVNAKGLCAL